MNEHEQLALRFEESRGHLRAVAYRMLGSLAEAEDAVQEAWLRFGGVLRALMPLHSETTSVGSTPADTWALLELLRPLRSVGVASQAETQGVRSEAFMALHDLP